MVSVGMRVHCPGFVCHVGTVVLVLPSGWCQVHWDIGTETFEAPGAVVEHTDADERERLSVS
jgi:hypothetical protein